MKRKHKVLSWWASLILTFVGLLSIVGVTVLVMYLTGRFDEVIVWPQDMTFSNEVEGMGFFEDNSVDNTKNLYVASDFSLTISTSTEDVTKDSVTLFLDGDKNKQDNGVISVPKTVRLNRPFEIKLKTDDKGFANGGRATITAVSEDERLERQTINVFVDKPAQDFEVGIAEHEGENVVIGSTFNLEVGFTPEESAKAFSKNDQEKRFFFVNSKTFIDYDWDNEHFYTKLQSGDGYDTITVYAFANAFFQKEVLDRFSSVLNRPSELNSDVTTYLSQRYKPSESTYLMKEIKVYVTNATVTIVNMDSNEKSLQGTCDKFFVLTTKSESSEENRGTLGISIQENATSPSMDGLLGNVGIKIPKTSTIKIDNRRMDRPEIAGKVLKVVKTTEAGAEGDEVEEKYEMTYETFDYANYSKYVEAEEGTEYYILPSTSTKSATDYYWRIVATDTEEHELSVNFFSENNDGTIANFFEFAGEENPEKTFKFSAQRQQEEAATWIQNPHRIEMEISFDDAGEEESAQVLLSDFVEEVPATNVFTKTKFFLFATQGPNASASLSNLELKEYFNVKDGVTYKNDYLREKLNILGHNNESGYVLYELETDDVLIAKKRLPSSLNAYALIAILKTDVDGNVETTVEEGVTKYQIVNLSDLKAISVESLLSIARMDPQISFTSAAVKTQDEDGRYYLPAVNRDENQARPRVIDFLFKYRCADGEDAESWDVDSRRILNAFDSGDLRIVCVDENLQEYENQYVRLTSAPVEMYGPDEDHLSPTGTRGQTLYFQGEISIEEEYFASSADADHVTEKDIYLLLKYDNTHELFSKPVQGKDLEAGNGTFSHFVVYYQTPQKLEAGYMTDSQLQGAKNISVEIGGGQEGSGDVKMTWGTYEFVGQQGRATIQEVLAFINSRLDYKIFDKHGLPINTDVDTGLYRILFSEGAGANLLRFNDKQNSIVNFISTNSQSRTTKLIVEVSENVTGGSVWMSDELDFTIKSVGVSKLEKEKGEDVLASDLGTDENYEDNGDTGMVTIRKRLKPGADRLDLTQLVRIYLGDSQDFYPEGDIKVQFNPTFISRLEEKGSLSKDLAAMLHFWEATTGEEIEDTTADTMAAYADIDLKYLQVRYPFNSDTTLEFVITDADRSRFYIPLNLVLVKQAEIVGVFGTFNHTKGYDDFLVELEATTPALFADYEYDLNDLFRFTNIKDGDEDVYTWRNALQTDGLLETSGGQGNLLSIQKESATLKIGTANNFEPVRFTLYYGVKSYYALHTEATVYINPNIAIVEKKIAVGQNAPFVNLNEISEISETSKAKILNNFVFCRATDYVDKVVNGTSTVDELSGGEIVDISGWLFENKNADDKKFINIETKDREKIYTFVEDAPALNLQLGQNVGQTFSISTLMGNINAVVVKEFADNTREIILSVDEKNVVKGAEIDVEIGFGENEVATIDEILYRLKKPSGTASEPGTAHVQIVKFKVKENGQDVLKTFVVLAGGTNYEIGSDFMYASSTGGYISRSANGIYTGTNDAFFNSNNTLTVNASPKDANGKSLKNLSVTINVIISRIGEKFVYYDPEGEYKTNIDQNTMKFNAFGNADFYTLIHDPALAGAFQKVQAGSTFTLFHVLNQTTDENDDLDLMQEGEIGPFGFYYDYKRTNAGRNSVQDIRFEAYKLENGIKTALNAADLCTLVGNNLTINHLSEEYENTYIEIELPFTYINASFSFKYRIKIVPDFKAGSVNYPYAENVEHLDPLASAYVGDGRYEIELDTAFDETNSKAEQNGKKRFVDPTWLKKDETIKPAGKYEIASATANGQTVENFADNEFFSYEIVDTQNETETVGKKLIVTLKQEDVQLVLVLKKTFTAGDLDMFGGDLSYELRFNMGTAYNTNVLHSHEGEAEQIPCEQKEQGIFTKTIKANEAESIFDISVTIGENVSTPVNDLNFFIRAKEGGTLGDALQQYADHGDAYAYLETSGNNKRLRIKPVENISQNVVVEIGIFTSERVVLKIEVTVAGYYTYARAQAFEGGKEYSYLGTENAIFTTFTDDSSGTPQSISESNDYTLEITLENGTETVSIQNSQVAKEKLVKVPTEGDWKSRKIEFAHLPINVTFRFQATVTRTSDGSHYTFSFEITVAKSVDTFSYTTDIGNIYGGVKYLLGLGSVGAVTETNVFDKMENLENKFASAGTSGQYEFTGEGITFVKDANGNEIHKTIVFTPENVGKDTESSRNFAVKYTFNNVFTLTYTLRLTFHIFPSVEVNLHTPAPDGKIYSSKEYLDTTNTASESAPTYQAEIDNFFGSTDFAMKNGAADFDRVTVDKVKDLKDKNIEIAKNWNISVAKIENVILKFEFGETSRTITDESSTKEKQLIDNTMTVEGKALKLTFELVDSSRDGTVELAIVVNNCTAKLDGKESNYVIQVLRGGVSAVGIVTNATNYENDAETVYAEDLASYSNKELFKNDRIIQFNAKRTGTYHLKFTNGSDTKHIEVYAAQADVITNVDAGEVLTDYDFAGAYSAYDPAKGFQGAPDQNSNFNSLPIITSRLVAIYAPNTPDAKEIALDETINFAIAKEIVDTSTNATAESTKTYFPYENIKLSSGDNGKQVKFTIVIAKNYKDLLAVGSKNENELEKIQTSGIYNMALRIDFEVTNNADGFEEYEGTTHNTAHASIFKQDLIAGRTYTLFGDGGSTTLNNFIQIRSPRDNAIYTRSMIESRSGKLKVDLYGFANVPILDSVGNPITEGGGSSASVPSTWSQKEKALAMAAGRIHDNLKSEEVELSSGETIKYFTGLTPRAGDFSLNTLPAETNVNNYLVLSPKVGAREDSDYDFIAQGCNNDGNHVMVKVTYTVDMGEGEPIKECHNLLFRIVPNAMNGDVAANDNNTSISFMRNFGESNTPERADMSRTFNSDQTFANNYSHPFIITDAQISAATSAAFNLVNTNANGTAAGTGSMSVISANMYSKTANDIRNFEFTYEDSRQTLTTDNETKIANDFGGALNWETDKWSTEASQKTGTPTSNTTGSVVYTLSVGLNKNAVSMGERLYYIDFENTFGYRGRFFFKIVATDNPTIKGMKDDVLMEGDLISVGTEFKNIDISANSNGTYQYDGLVYDPNYDVLEFKTTPKSVSLSATIADGTINCVVKDVKNKISIWKDKEWKKGDEKFSEKDKLKGVKITIFVEYETGKGEPFDATITNVNDKEELGSSNIVISSTEKTDYGNPFESTGTTDTAGSKTHQVTLANLSAYAFSGGTVTTEEGVTDIKSVPVDSATKEKYKSNINDIQVERIDFYYAGKWIGGSYGDDKILSSSNDEETDFFDEKGTKYKAGNSNFHKSQELVTDSTKYFYVNKDKNASEYEWKAGNTENKFAVPHINPRVFGNLKTLSNVTMNITLTTTTQETENARNKAVLSRRVSITREDVKLFDQTDILDGSSPTTGVTTGVTNVLNDTIEVTLGAKESTTFIVHSKPLYNATEDPADKETKDSVVMNPDGSVTVTRKVGKQVDGKLTADVTTWNVQPITITNTSNYTQTYYYSITDHLLDNQFLETNPGSGSKFYIYEFNFWKENEGGTGAPQASGAEFAYNGKTRTGTGENQLKFNIIGQLPRITNGNASYIYYTNGSPAYNEFAEYSSANALRLYIPSVEALSGSDNTMSRRLYFLYLKDGQSYQYSQDFKIHQQYANAAKDPSAQGPIGEIHVGEYVEVSKGNEKFYYIPLSSWAGTSGGKLTLEPSVDSGGTSMMGENPYKFTFASESAIVDEFGTLMTTSNFEISSKVIDVTIYMNVSGFDGNFEEHNQKLEIGKFNIRLIEKDSEDFEEVNGAAGKVYKFSAAPLGIMYVPQGFTAKTIGITLTEYTSSATNAGSFACAVGETIDFTKLLGTDGRNVTYHILNDGDKDIYCQNNFNSWTFTSSGEKTVKLLRTRYSGTGYVYELLTVTMHVYNTNDSSAKAFAIPFKVENSADEEPEDTTQFKFLMSSIDDTAGATWFKLDRKTNQVAECDIEKGKPFYTIDKTKGQVQSQTFIMSGSGVYKTYDVTFYAYETTNEKTIGLTKGATYNLQNLAEGTCRFFELEEAKPSAEENAQPDPIVVKSGISTFTADGSDNYVEKQLLCVTEDNTVTRIDATFLIANAAADKSGGTFAYKWEEKLTNKDDPSKFYVHTADISNKVKELFGLKDKDVKGVQTPDNYSNLAIYTAESSGILTTLPAEKFEVSSANKDKIELIVHWTANGVHNVKRTTIMLYAHENEQEIEVTIGNLAESDMFELSQVNAQVLATINDWIDQNLGTESDKDASGVVTYSRLNATTGLKNVVTRIGSLSNTSETGPDFDETFYVEIGERAFLIHLKLNVKDVSSDLFVSKHTGNTEQGEDESKSYVSKDVIEKKVKDLFGLKDTDGESAANFSELKIYTGAGVLTEIPSSIEAASENHQELNLVVCWKDAEGKQNIKCLTLVLYYHENAEAIEVTVDDLDESDSFELSQVNSAVLDAINKTLDPDKNVSGEVTYSRLDPTTGLKEKVEEIGSLAETGEEGKPDFDETFYVEVGGRAFLIRLKLNVKVAAVPEA